MRAYSASLPVSPVRMRTTCSSVVTKIFPSPILPVRAELSMASMTRSTMPSHLGQEVDHVLRAAVQLGVALLAAEALDFGHGDALDADAAEGFAHFVQLERFDDRSHHLHGLCSLGVCDAGPDEMRTAGGGTQGSRAWVCRFHATVPSAGHAPGSGAPR